MTYYEAYREMMEGMTALIVKRAMDRMVDTMEELADRTFDRDTARDSIRDAAMIEYHQLMEDIRDEIYMREDDMVSELTDVAVGRGYDYDISKE